MKLVRPTEYFFLSKIHLPGKDQKNNPDRTFRVVHDSLLERCHHLEPNKHLVLQ